jgi:hypothetical protein
VLKFDNLYIVSHQPGTLGDSLVAFLSMHNKKSAFNIVGSRMRTSTPGILLNWASYYKNWPTQRNDPNLYKQLNLCNGISNFVQAHFFLKEHEITQKFPGSQAIRILVDDPDNMEIYFKYLYQKLINKKMYRAWFDRYSKFAWLNNNDTYKTLLGMCVNKTLKVKHYWAAWHIDNQGLNFSQVPNPMKHWLEQDYIQDFHPNLNTMLIDNQKAMIGSDESVVIDLYIDRMWPINSTSMNNTEYERLCDLTGLTPDYKLAKTFWDWRRLSQPNPDQIKVSRNWL